MMVPLQQAEAQGAAGRSARVDNRPYDEEGIKHYNSAVEMQQAGKIDEAINEYQLAIVRDNRIEEAWSNLGGIYAAQKNYTKASLAFEKALSLRPDRPASLNGYGTVLFERGKVREAKEKWRQAIGMDPSFAAAHFNLANALESEGNNSGAKSEYEAAFKADPELPDVVERLSQVKEKLAAEPAVAQAPAAEQPAAAVSVPAPPPAAVADATATASAPAGSPSESAEDEAAEQEMHKTLNKMLGTAPGEDATGTITSTEAARSNAADGKLAEEADKDAKKDSSKITKVAEKGKTKGKSAAATTETDKGAIEQAVNRPTVATRLAGFRKRMVTAMNRGTTRAGDKSEEKSGDKSGDKPTDKSALKSEKESPADKPASTAGAAKSEPAESKHRPFFMRRAAQTKTEHSQTDESQSEQKNAKPAAAESAQSPSAQSPKDEQDNGAPDRHKDAAAAASKKRLAQIAQKADALKGPKETPAAAGLPPPSNNGGQSKPSEQPKKVASIAGITSIGKATIKDGRLEHPPAPFKIAGIATQDALTQAFDHDPSWRGADGACSVALTPNRSLWLFGDTMVRIDDNKGRAGKSMINNTAAWQTHDPLEFKFFWRTVDDDPHAVVVPEDKSHWFWPTDAAITENRLYLVSKLIVPKKATPPEFSFDWVGDELLCVDKPNLPPDQWKPRHIALPEQPGKLLMGAGSLVSGSYFYIYCSLPEKVSTGHPHPIGLARIYKRALLQENPTDWQYLTVGATGIAEWSKSPDNMVVLFEDGAAEITVSKVNGEQYFVATYMPPLSSDVMLRFAKAPEGPWSEPVKAYTCAESALKVLGKNVMVYSAKDHPELSKGKDQMVVTYCVNPGDLEQQNKRPDLYFPRALTVTLSRAGAGN
ncbi:MAG TPA: tetratricopeptide repeat protein [Chroococcales cyanobacterium]